ncbi:protein kinase domain containing protein [Nannochloropsis gaditana]|uniref:Protein kinase domain containing protein n=1 Tax=Nannochloropsis gaditana TaxID=72520 RepID=W7TTT1_9STRA|nr:protein kinase domain containing protein [Nannochloropsis gaditana]
MRRLGPYYLGQTIGEGTFGRVKAGVHALTGEKVAIKLLEKNRIVDAGDVRRVTREIDILKRNRHRNIIQLYDVLDTPARIYLVMENADGGELFDYIVKRQRVPEPEASAFFKQLVDGVGYLHAMEVTHRDLKPENLLLQSSKSAPGGWCVKIIDFGLSNTHEAGTLLSTACGSPCYACPEMIRGLAYRGPAADVWSMGVILYAMVCGYLPFEHTNISKLYHKILAGRYTVPSFLSPGVKDLIAKILVIDPQTRYSIPDIQRHPWYRQLGTGKRKDVKATQYQEARPPPGADCKEEEDGTGCSPPDVNVKLDENVLQEAVSLGLDREELLNALRLHAFGSLTATYHLLNRRRNSHGTPDFAGMDQGSNHLLLLAPSGIHRQQRQDQA